MATPIRPTPARAHLLADKHAAFIASFAKDRTTFEAVATDHMRLSGVYWGLAALDALDRLDVLLGGADSQADALATFVAGCARPGGGYGGSERQDPHLLHTLSAVQVAAIIDRWDILDADAIMEYVSSLQRPDGSFAGDAWGEIDTRFSYCALAIGSLLGRLDALDVPRAVAYLAACRNFDGGFGATPGCESHAGQAFTCVAALAIAASVHPPAAAVVDADLLAWWLAERQTPTGGLNGRPEKLPDVCYSWWCLSCLAILGRTHWVDAAALTAFILACQDEHGGGISDRPDDAADVYHTFFGIAGLGLLQQQQGGGGGEGGGGGDAMVKHRVDATYALTERALARTAVGRKGRV